MLRRGVDRDRAGLRAGYGRGDRKLRAEDGPRVIEALRRCCAIKNRAAKMLRVSVQTLYRYLAEHAAVREQLEDVAEELLDLAEEKLHDKIRAGDLRACIFFLEHKGRHRGWGREPVREVVQVVVPPRPSTAEILAVLERIAEEGRQRRAAEALRLEGPGDGES